MAATAPLMICVAMVLGLQNEPIATTSVPAPNWTEKECSNFAKMIRITIDNTSHDADGNYVARATGFTYMLYSLKPQ